MCFPRCRSSKGGLLVAKRKGVMTCCAACRTERQCVILTPFVNANRLKYRLDFVDKTSGNGEVDVHENSFSVQVTGPLMSSMMFACSTCLVKGPQFLLIKPRAQQRPELRIAIALRCNGSFPTRIRPAPKSFEARTRLQEYPADLDVAIKADEIIPGREFQKVPLVVASGNFKGRQSLCRPR